MWKKLLPSVNYAANSAQETHLIIKFITRMAGGSLGFSYQINELHWVIHGCLLLHFSLQRLTSPSDTATAKAWPESLPPFMEKSFPLIYIT